MSAENYDFRKQYTKEEVEFWKKRKDEKELDELIAEDLKNDKGSGIAALLFFSVPILGYFLIKNGWFPTWFKVPMYAINIFTTLWMIASIFNGKCI